MNSVNFRGILEVGISIWGLAAVGATLGSSVPVVGTLFGGAIGAIIGVVLNIFREFFLPNKDQKSRILSAINDKLIDLKNEFRHNITEYDSVFYKTLEMEVIEKNILLLEDVGEVFIAKKSNLILLVDDIKKLKV